MSNHPENSSSSGSGLETCCVLSLRYVFSFFSFFITTLLTITAAVAHCHCLFIILTNPDQFHHHLPTPTTGLIIFGLRHYFCLVPHFCPSPPTLSYSTISSSLLVPVSSWFSHPYQLQTLSQNLYHLSSII